MGSSASKGARAAGSAARKYPSRVSKPTTHAPSSAPPAGQALRRGPTVHPKLQASEIKTEAIDLDARDPTFAAQLRSLGAVQPNPHFSPTSTSPLDPQRNTSSIAASEPSTSFPPEFPDPSSNPALSVLAARQRLQEEAEQEIGQLGRRGFAGRRFMDVGVVRQALIRRERGEDEEKIERDLGIRRGRLGVLGKGIAESV